VYYGCEKLETNILEDQFGIEKILRAAIDNTHPDEFLYMLSAVNQEKHKSRTSSPNCERPKFYWIFKNVDYERWWSSSSAVLLLSGPPLSGISQAALYIVDQAKNTKGEASGTEPCVLYFFCSTAAGTDSITTVFVRSLLHQIVSHTRKKWVIATFLCALLKGILSRNSATDMEQWWLDVENPIKKILNVSQSCTNENCDALMAVLEAQQLQLYIIVAGLENAKGEKREFISKVREIVEQLQGRDLMVKALLTGRVDDEIKDLLSGVPVIEYDKERKGSFILHSLLWVCLTQNNAECLNSLRFDNIRYNKISKEHKGSIEWLWTHEEYQKWTLSLTSRLFCIEGKPGSGKSTLMKYFKNKLLERESNANSAIIASFFYSYRDGESQTSHYNMLRSILYDILQQDESFFYHFQPEFRRYQALIRGSSHGDHIEFHYESLKNILRSIGNHPSQKQVYLLIDAVDESSDEERRDVLQLLYELCSSDGCCIIKVFIASRPVVELQPLIRKSHAFIRMQDVNKPDIQNFVHSLLEVELELELPENILHEAKRYIFENAHGVFLWVHLVGHQLVEYIEKGYSHREIFGFLKSLPTELEGLYQRIITNLEMNAEKGRAVVGKRMFQLVLFMHRPLTVSEFQHALAIAEFADTELTPSGKSFQEALIIGIEKRIIHCGCNLLEVKGHNGIFFIEYCFKWEFNLM